MDVTNVQVLRSEEGQDVLCVDSYLYQFEDRGLFTYRWACTKSLDTPNPCPCRIITTFIADDDSEHRVQKVVGEHTHIRCTANEIIKVLEQGNPLQSSNELKRKMSPIMQVAKRIVISQGNVYQVEEVDVVKDDEEYVPEPNSQLYQNCVDRDDNDDVKEDGYVEVCDYEEEQEVAQQCEIDNKDNINVDNDVVELAEAAMNDDNFDSNTNMNVEETTQVNNFKKNKVYMLRTGKGRQMICMNGYLYRLEGKSQKYGTFHWDCIRRDVACRVVMHTDSIINGCKVKKNICKDDHTHEPYTQKKLWILLNRHNINVINYNDRPIFRDTPFESSRLLDGVEVFSKTKQNMEMTVIRGGNDMDLLERKWPSVLEETAISTAAESTARSWDANSVFVAHSVSSLYTLVKDPVIALSNGTRTAENKLKYTFLPSAKGNNVLCMDNYIYHFDSRSPRNGHSYWTCILRRDKLYRCNGRITTEMTNNGPVILKVSGVHMHPNNASEIQRRLHKSLVEKRTSKTKQNTYEIQANQFGDDFKTIVAKSRQTIKRRVGRLRKTMQGNVEYSQSDSSSSSSSALESDDDDESDNTHFPTNLDELRQKVPKENTNLDGTCFDIDGIIEEIPADNEQVFKQENSYVEYETFEEELLENVNEYHYVSNNNYKEEKLWRNESEDEVESEEDFQPDMDITKISKLRSAKGGALLCVDGYIYHMKSTQNLRTYWSCIKCKDRIWCCKSRIGTEMGKHGIKVVKVTNHHTHPVNEDDIKRRLYNEYVANGISYGAHKKEILQRSLFELSEEYAEIIANSKGAVDRHIVFHHETPLKRSNMKLYAVSDGPPSLAVRMALKALNISFDLINIDYIASEHLSEEYAQMNPQKEIPVLDDDGFLLSESIAIMQYICDKFSPDNKIYPKNARQRAVINHRLCFNMGFYYSAISAHVMAPIFFDYQRTEMSLKKVNNALQVFQTYLERSASKYAAGENVTIADYALVASTLCLEAIGFDLSPYPLVQHWYDKFKKDKPELWEIGRAGMLEIKEFERNPPDLSHMNHPFHPTRKMV